ncbi:MAG: hypothetical protein ABI262_13930 [Microcoleus sp.]
METRPHENLKLKAKNSAFSIDRNPPDGEDVLNSPNPSAFFLMTNDQ